MKARRKTRERERERKKGRFSQHVSHWRLFVPPLIRDSTKDVRARKRERERVHSRYPQSRLPSYDFPTLCKRHLSFETPSSLRLWLVKGLLECFPPPFIRRTRGHNRLPLSEDPRKS